MRCPGWTRTRPPCCENGNGEGSREKRAHNTSPVAPKWSANRCSGAVASRFSLLASRAVIHVALTGNVAAGKSSVARLFAAWGATVIDADAIVHELQQPGTPVLAAMVARFGPGILRADGQLDRPALRRLVLEDPAARRDLEAIVHPAVAARRDELVAAAAQRQDAILVSDIPLLFEVADPGAFDQVVLVDAPEAERRRRLVDLRGLPAAEADRLLAAQIPSGEKRSRSTHVIENHGTPEELEVAARRVWERIASAARRA